MTPQLATNVKARSTTRPQAWWSTITAAIGTVVGLAPHVLHHIGLLAGAALIAGTGGTIVFGAIGLVASVPLLLRLKRRFHGWWAPLIGLAAFAFMFSLSAFVIGPTISGNRSPNVPPGDRQPSPTVNDTEHHG